MPPSCKVFAYPPLALETLEPRTLLSAGDLDTTFSGDGVANLPLAGNGVEVQLQSDGKAVLAGTAQINQKRTLVVIRFNADGTVDNSFATSGVYQLAIGGTAEGTGTHQAGLAIRSDGKIVVAASNLLLRFTASGQLDSTFGGGDGIAKAATQLYELVLLPDNSIYAGGDGAIWHFSPGGAVDSNFGDNGAVNITALTGSTFTLADIASAPNGKVVVLGRNLGPVVRVYDYSYTRDDETVLRLTSTGDVDSTFGTGTGMYRVEHVGAGPFSCAVQSDGKILLADYGVISRLNADGTVDKSFGASQKGEAKIHESQVLELAIQPDGKILAVTDTYYDYYFRDASRSAILRPPAVVRLNANGTQDKTLSYDGIVTLPLDRPDGRSTGVALDPSGKVVVAGIQTTAYGVDQPNFIYVARIETAGPTSASFAHVTSTGTLVVTGTAKADRIDIFKSSDGEDILRYNNELLRFQNVQRISIDAGDGDDTVAVYPYEPTTILGGAGNDSLDLTGDYGDGYFNASAFGELDGGPGNDSLDGAAGDDTLIGGEGDDTLQPGFGNNELFGNAGNDTAAYDKLIEGNWEKEVVVVSLDDLANDGFIGSTDERFVNLSNIHSDIENVIGSKLPNHIIGSNVANLLKGGPGADTIEAGAGNDTLDGGAGADLLNGGSGHDSADYSSRTKPLIITLGPSSGGSGEVKEGDQISITVEQVLGGSANDLIVGNKYNNLLVGNGGKDTLSGNGGRDALFGGGGNDKMFGGAGNDYLEGGSGNDTLSGDAGADTLLGQGGKDLLLALDHFKDTLDGGAASNRASRDKELDTLISIQTIA